MRTLALIFCLALSTFSIAQECKKTGAFFNSADITTSGSLEIRTNKKGKVQLIIQNDFKTQEGPDLDVYLSKDKMVTEGNSVRLDALFLQKGYQKYIVPSSVKLEDYQYVVIHCTQYNHWYGSAKLENCPTK